MARVRTLVKKERLVDFANAYEWLFQVMALLDAKFGQLL